MNPVDIAVLAFGIAGLAAVWRANLWRAVLCLFPQSIQLGAHEPASAPVPQKLSTLAAQLAQLGFVSLGSHYEKPRFGPELISQDFGHPDARAFASVYVVGGVAKLYFLTATDTGAFVITSNFRRPAREVPGRYLAGALENLPLERVWNAHLRRASTLGDGVGPVDAEKRLELAELWFRGPGRSEIRQQNALGLLWTVGTLGMVGALCVSLRR